MLKTFAENSIGTAVRTFWKQFVGLVTGLRNRYLSDPFFHSEFNVVLLQIAFAGSLVFVVTLYFNNIYKDVSETIINGVLQSIRSGTILSGEEISEQITTARREDFLAFLVIASLITFAFSYFIAHVTLTPLRNALKIQKRFIGDIAHELRTPLSVIKTNTEVALLDRSIPLKLSNTMHSNIEELNRTSDIINNLLSFGKLMQPDNINFSNVNLGTVVDLAIARVSDLAAKKKLKITVKKIGPYNVWGNSTALEQVTNNILKNSVNYTSPGGNIDIKIEPDYRGNVNLLIKDNGIGIEKRDLVHIFEPFYRAESSRNRRSGSSGLGLTIVSELIKLHSGRITIKSEPNRGTEVSIFLPREKTGQISKIGPKRENEISKDFMQRNQTS